MATLSHRPIRPEDLERRLRTVGGRDRIDAALVQVATDIVAPFEGELSPEERAWLEARIARAVHVAIEPALAAFLEELSDGLTAAPEDLIAHVRRAALRAELGGE
ncbi:MAG TPA: hypothetical protein VF763_03950 [Candidatus Limnocylindrales bacterium]